MSTWRYRALAADGRRVRGELDAADLRELERMLEARALLLLDARPRGTLSLLQRKRIPRSELIPFCYHLEQLLAAGVPPFESLAALRDAGADPRLQQVIDALIADVERGLPLSGAAARQPEAFSAVAVSLLRAGEQAGRLPEAIRDIGAALAQEEELAGHARRIAIYPSIVATVLLAAVVVALVHVVPELERLLRGTGQRLPLQTRILMGLSGAVRDWGWAMLLCTLGGTALGAHALARSEPLRTRLHALQLRLPLVGGILRKLALARFAALFATLYGAGINVIEALHTSTGATANLALRAGLREATGAIEQGRPISVAFEATQVFPPLVIRMLRLGEHTGALDDALAKVASLYRRDVAEGIARLQAAAEPALTILMGGLLLWIASAILGPIYELITRLPV